MFNFIKYSKIYFSVALILALASIIALASFGLNLGMDFQGGTSIKVEYENKIAEIEQIKDNLSIENYELQSFGDKGIILKIKNKDIEATQLNSILEELSIEGNTIIDSEFQTISPVIGKELKNKTILVAIVALTAMLLYIAFAFNKVSGPISPFQYGLVSTLMLFNDILIPLGVLAFLGKYLNVELTIPIVTAILAVIGYSINNNIVIFDRIRENLRLYSKLAYSEVVNKSLNQVIVRCVNTSLTTLFVLTALYYFFIGEGGIEYFALTALIGIVVGTLSSIFLSSPILSKWAEKK
jgi:preprotein translocase subunit SecF